MVTLEAGRVRPDDKTTIQLVLEAAPQIGSNYSVIINKMSSNILKKLSDNENDRKVLVTTINDGLAGTSSIYFNIKYAQLEDEDNGVVVLDDKLISFINSVKPIEISADKVKSIAVNNFEKIQKELAEQLELMKRDNEYLRQRVQEQEGRLAEMRANPWYVLFPPHIARTVEDAVTVGKFIHKLLF